jgi:hypothetical protein
MRIRTVHVTAGPTLWTCIRSGYNISGLPFFFSYSPGRFCYSTFTCQDRFRPDPYLLHQPRYTVFTEEPEFTFSDGHEEVLALLSNDVSARWQYRTDWKATVPPLSCVRRLISVSRVTFPRPLVIVIDTDKPTNWGAWLVLGWRWRHLGHKSTAVQSRDCALRRRFCTFRVSFNFIMYNPEVSKMCGALPPPRGGGALCHLEGRIVCMRDIFILYEIWAQDEVYILVWPLLGWNILPID